MRIAYELCLATAGKQVPDGPAWIHEVKHDGYRMLVIRENERVRLLSRNGLLFARPAQHLRVTRASRWRSDNCGSLVRHLGFP